MLVVETVVDGKKPAFGRRLTTECWGYFGQVGPIPAGLLVGLILVPRGSPIWSETVHTRFAVAKFIPRSSAFKPCWQLQVGELPPVQSDPSQLIDPRRALVCTELRRDVQGRRYRRLLTRPE